MKNLNLDAFDVQGMSTQEMKQTDGGWVLAVCAALAMSIAYDLVSNGPDTISSFQDGFNDGYK